MIKNNKTVSALGIFDGVHLGHRLVLGRAIEEAQKRGLSPAVFTFNAGTVTTKGELDCLLTDEDKRGILKELGFSIVYSEDLSRLKDMSAKAFVDEILIKRMNVSAAVCGDDFRFGKNAAADCFELKRLCAEHGVDVIIIDRLHMDGSAVSSSRIRELIRNGDIGEANKLLGYEYGYRLPVIHGFARGRTWSFPTINQALPKGLVLPRFGVYCSLVTIGAKSYAGVTNIGVKPTVEKNSPPLAETFIIGFDGDLYGQTIELRLCGFVRSERTFASFEELKDEIARNTSYTVKFFEKYQFGKE